MSINVVGTPLAWSARTIALDSELIQALVPTGSRVLDLGCGNGQLLDELAALKGCQGRGIEIDEEMVVVVTAGCRDWAEQQAIVNFLYESILPSVPEKRFPETPPRSGH